MTLESEQIALDGWCGETLGPVTSLDVLYEMETKLAYGHYLQFETELESIAIRDARTKDFRVTSATAAQRREALLRTPNLWED